MVIAAVVVGVGSIASAAVSAHAAGQAESAQVNAAQNQIQLDQAEFNQEQQNEAPYMAAGTKALDQLTAGFAPGGDFTKTFDPGSFAASPEYAGYQFQKTQGDAAIGAGGAARGQATNGKAGGVSAATGEALAKYNQGLAGTSYQNWYDDAYNKWFNTQQTQIKGLEGLTQVGENAVAGVNRAGEVATASEVQSEGAIGNAQAAGAEAKGAAWNSAIGGVTGAIAGYETGGMYTGGAGGGMNTQQYQDFLQNQYYSNLFGNGNGFTTQDLATASTPQFQDTHQTGLAPAGGGYTINVPTGP